MDENLGKFIDSFAQLVQLAQAGQHRPPAGQQLLTTLTGHLGVPAESVSVVVEDIPPHRFVDADIQMAELAGEIRSSGWSASAEGPAPPPLLERHAAAGADLSAVPAVPARLRQLGNGSGRAAPGGGAGALVVQPRRPPDRRAAAGRQPRYGRQAARLEVLAGDTDSAAAFLADFRRRMQHHSVLKGQVISLVMGEYGPSAAGVTFHTRPTLAAADVVLPDGLLQKVSDHALGIAEHRDTLNRYGQHLKRGILLYGRPGTGKTHTVRYLLSRTQGATAILLSGGSLARISEAATMARALQPSIVVLEDCDLIAEDRSFGHGPQPLLFEVLDAMDGLASDADVAFVLTTNRVDMLEQAWPNAPAGWTWPLKFRCPRSRAGGVAQAVFPRDRLQHGCTRGGSGPHGRNHGLVRPRVDPPRRRGRRPGRRPGRGRAPSGAVGALMADGEALTRSLLGSGAGARGDGGGTGSSGAF